MVWEHGEICENYFRRGFQYTYIKVFSGVNNPLYIEMATMLPNLDTQINKFASFQDAFGIKILLNSLLSFVGVHKTVEAFDTISNLLLKYPKFKLQPDHKHFQ